MGQLEGKVAIVTGAGGGIGRATAVHLHDEGAAVLATDRSAEAVKELGDLVPDSDRWAAQVLDVTDEEQFSGVVQAAVARFGKLTGIVNNAGILIPGTIVDSTVDDYDKTFAVNVKGVYLGCKYAVPAMLRSGGGSIVNFGSINSLAAEKQLTVYCASKGAVLMLTKAIALDFGGQGIRANAVCPGFVDTPLNVPHYMKLGGREQLERDLVEWQPIGRAIEPIEIARSVAFLLSDNSSAITGTAFVVDGGVLCKA